MAIPLKNMTRSGLDTIFTNLNDIVESVTLSKLSNTASAYDPATGTVSAVTSDDFSLNVIFGSYSSMEIIVSDGLIANTDIKVFIKQKDLTALGTDPEVNDFITRGTTKYRIEDVKKEPSEAVVICRLRGVQT